MFNMIKRSDFKFLDWTPFSNRVYETAHHIVVKGEMSESYKTLNEVEKKVSSERILEVLSVKAQVLPYL